MNSVQKPTNDPSKENKFKTVTRQVIRTKDGKLNYVSLGLIGLIFCLLGSLTYYTVQKTSPKAIQDAVVEGLSDENMEKAIQEAFLTGIEEYLNGDITKDEVHDRIMQLIADYLNSTSAFTDDQKLELQDIISKYLADIDIENLVSNNTENIEHVQNELKKYMTKNVQTLELLKNSLEEEINNNATYTQEQLDILNDLHKQLEKTELTHWNSINNHLAEAITKFDHLTEEANQNAYGGLQIWKANENYEINTLVIYNIGQDYERTNNVTENDRDVRIYKNQTGVNTDVSPNKDTTNWLEMSVAEAVQNLYNITTGDVAAFDEWVKNHKTNSDGSVIDQYVTYNNNIYQNITGEYDPDKTPDKDTTNWEQLSIMQALEKNLQEMITNIQGEMASYKDWLENHTTDADGSVIHQYVTYHNEVYQNITGEYDPSKTPDKDTTNWEKVSVFDAIEKNLHEMIDNMYKDLSAYTEWLENHKTNAGGDVINQYVTYEEKLYQNISGEYDPSKTPDQDPTNWKEVSLGESIVNVYNTYITDTFGDTAGWSADAEYKIDNYVSINLVLIDIIFMELILRMSGPACCMATCISSVLGI
ncbi:MAG: hypothetical protein K5883_06475, partial [Pseudobutyrivibrio sp.]|nr:hypothetical protein [Pseudobutyrivibrio sp.]